jgi:hypothetical protein
MRERCNENRAHGLSREEARRTSSYRAIPGSALFLRQRSLWRVTLAVTNALRSLEILAFGEARSIRVTRGVTSRRVQGQYSVARAITVRGQPGE